MRLGLSAISTVNASFEEDVIAYAAAGFDAIGLWEFKLPPDDEGNVALLHEYGLEVAVCVPAIPAFLSLGVPGMEGPEDPAVRVEALRTSVTRLARYSPEAVVCLSGPLGGRPEAEGRAIVVDGLRQVAAVARTADVQLAFEPIHRSQRDSTSFVNSIEAALGILAEAGTDEVGILLDTYHVWDDPAVWDFIARASYRIAGVHVADWPADTSRTDRELPGRGISRTKELLEAIEISGWDGILDIEIFGDPEGYWGLDVAEAARQAHDALAALL